MAKILFISDNFIDEGLGIMCLSSYLKANGHEVALTLLSQHSDADSLLSFVKNVRPDLVAFSAMTPQVDTFRPITKLIKEHIHAKIIWGGPHCIFMPENAATDKNVDIICTGEGEEALLSLMNRLNTGSDYTDIPGLWVRRPDRWVKNEIGSLEENLDKYPFPDRDLYYGKYKLLRDFAVKRFITQRGCPYDCSYCFEPMLKNLYKGKGRLVRRHSVRYVIDEIKEVARRYPTKTVHFSDDTFNLDKKWVMDFLLIYRREIGLPFTCNISVLNIDDELIKAMKNNGCAGVVFGVESGLERMRIELLNKKIPNEKYIEAAALLRKYNMKFAANMIFCLPSETIDDAVESTRFLKLLKPYAIKTNILKIYKGTNLAKFGVENSLCEAIGDFTYKPKDALRHHESIKNMMWAAYLFVKVPFIINFAKLLLRGPLSKLMRPMILLTYWQDIRFFGVPLRQAWSYFWHSRNVFLSGIGKEQPDDYAKMESLTSDIPGAD